MKKTVNPATSNLSGPRTVKSDTFDVAVEETVEAVVEKMERARANSPRAVPEGDMGW